MSKLSNDSTRRPLATLAELAAAQPTIRDINVSELMLACLCTRGKRKGRVLKSIPNKSDAVRGAWRALMSELAPTRAGLFALVFAGDEEIAGFKLVDEALQRDPRLRRAVQIFGQGYCEFNLWQYHHGTVI